MTSTLIDERAGHRTIADIRADLDLDDALKNAVPPPRCEKRRHGTETPCGALASWLVVASCGCARYFCEACRMRTLHDSARTFLYCDLHGAEPVVLTSVEWRPL